MRTDNYKKVIDEITNSSLIISGSLHGIILAEQYGIPAVLLADRCNFEQLLFKYRDYYFSSRRYEFPICHSIEDALKIRPTDIPDFTLQRKRLIDAFPKGLWN